MNNSGTEKSLARDKIAQVYLGEWGSEAFQLRSRRRIQWFVDQIEHGIVLDIGCSEGILPILLGRKGIEVIGVDINPEVIDYAKNLLTKEETETTARVTLVCDDFIEREWQEQNFDIVVLGEIIEHFAKPEILINKAIQMLKPGGKLLVTTPFGILPDPDHRYTFTLTTFLNFFYDSNITPISLTIVDSYIRYIAQNMPVQPHQWYQITASLLPLTEKGLLEVQSILRLKIDELADQRKELFHEISKQRKELFHQISDLHKEQAQSDKEFKKLEASYQKLIKNNNDLQNKYQFLMAENSTIKKQNQQLSAMNKKLALEKTAITDSISYKLSREIVSSLKPLRLSSLLLPIRLMKLSWQWINQKAHQ